MAWERLAQRLEGRIVTLEPLARKHEERLLAAASDPRIWRWTTLDAGASADTFRAWFASALEESANGSEAAFAVLRTAGGGALGSTRYMALRPEHQAKYAVQGAPRIPGCFIFMRGVSSAIQEKPVEGAPP